ncbi:TetR/AcrR family transcriptional regulator [Alkaliphilus serpentinus]|uniref:TetR/AcrR family transcriptional regulator n=1 Tax=Alkaliphilus serpentinus TaxID=1482731 RepID=A0A833HN35_9FIRM|nr:TetR/AcrR family transcriptional regulator [Alkaliphilus serpentinus]KAB3529176.1 TetR/AcrR family transcriptional regulator [Alkaliphilus serpentinus]
MGPRVKFTKEQIVDVAFEIAKEEGMDGITMRKIAEKLGSSVAPIYVNFKDIHELIEAVVNRIMEMSQQLLAEESTGNPFYDMGMASFKFAQEYSVLFRDLVLKDGNYLKNYDEDMLPMLVEEMKKDPELEGFSEEELKTILFKVRTFQLGLSVMTANGLLPKDLSIKDLMEILGSAAEDIVLSTRIKKNQ